MNIRRFVGRVLLAVLLLAGQYAALTHAVQHVSGSAPLQSPRDDGSKQNSQSSPCDFHVSLAQFYGAVDACELSLRVSGCDLKPQDEHPSRVYAARLLAPASRGPPALR